MMLVHSPRHRHMVSAILQHLVQPCVTPDGRLRPSRRVVWVQLIACAALAAAAHSAQVDAGVQTPAAPGLMPPPLPYRQDRILILPKPGADQDALASFHATQDCAVLQTFEAMGGMQILSLAEGQTVERCIAEYQRSGLVQFAEPDYVGHLAATPNDLYFTNGTLWGLHKIEAPAAWDELTSASNVVVAVLDTGVRYTHEDLAANMWVNPQDGGHGWNALSPTNPPSDDSGNGHGTMVTGVLGAAGNNGKGVVGVAWQVQIMACKCFNNQGLGTISDCVACMDYARTNGARIINASWGFTNSAALSNAVLSLRDAGIVVVAACGNTATNTDLEPTFPASYPLDNVVSVAATGPDDILADFSNYGATTVHLAAPGVSISSTFVATDSYYYTQSGTSFATPYVTGALALLLVKYPAESHQEHISRLLNGADPLPALAGKCVTGGRLNLRNALSPPIRLRLLTGATNCPVQLRVSAGPNRTCVIQAAPDLNSWSPVFTNTTSSAGTFDYTDTQSTNLTRRFYRAVSSL